MQKEPFVEVELDNQLRRAFLPLDAPALGVAIGCVSAIGLGAVTVLSMAVDPNGRFPLDLLGQYFVGYSVSGRGLLTGTVWALGAGFIGGWLMATTRNLVFAIWLLKARVRADLAASQDVLDKL